MLDIVLLAIIIKMNNVNVNDNLYSVQYINIQSILVEFIRRTL